MASNINNRPNQMWPWGGPRQVREKIVRPAQFEKTKKNKKLGNPKNPSLASAALLDWIGPAHSAEELRLPLPPHPEGHDADLEGRNDGLNLSSVAERNQQDNRRALERAFGKIQAAPDRVERMKALLSRESQMLNLIGQMTADVEDIRRKMKEEQAGEGI